MLKGVNKLIVEINNPESEYFEKAIFFVKPGKKDISAALLSDSAGTLIKNASGKGKKGVKSVENKRSGKIRRSYFWLAAAAGGAGAVITAAVMNLFQTI